MFDTHCHLDSPSFDADREPVLERARARGVGEIVIPSVGPATWNPLLEWARGRSGISVGLGIHPQLLPELDPQDDARHLAALEQLLGSGEARAIGECGLDGPSAEKAPLERQCRVLQEHLRLARRFDLPLLLHCLRAHDPLLALLREAAPVRAVLHSFSGSAEQAREYLALDHDLFFSFAGPVTYEKARKPLAAVRAVPADRLLLETDAPDQTPRPHRGRCEPAFLPLVAAAVADALGYTIEQVEQATSRNARRLFRLPEPLLDARP